MSQLYDIALVGADDLVGKTLLELLEERKFPVGQLYLLAPEQSDFEGLRFAGKTRAPQPIETFDWSQAHLAFFTGSDALSVGYAEQAAEAGCVVIDNSRIFLDQPAIPLVIPELNAELLADFRSHNLIASPAQGVTQLLLALKPIHDEVGVEQVELVSLQPVSGLGQAGVDELARQTASLMNGRPVEPACFGGQIAFNLLPQNEPLEAGGLSNEERRFQVQVQRLLGDERVRVNLSCVRVPVFFGHCQAVHLRTRFPIGVAEMRALLAAAPGLTVEEEASVTPVTHGSGQDSVVLSGLRQDEADPQGLNFWLLADDTRKGSATNCVQIAEQLVRDYL